MSRKTSKSEPNVKTAPKKPGKRSAARSSQSSEIKPEKQTNKTPQVMRLLELGEGSSNPVILAGKSRVPRMLSGREPLSRILRREIGDDFSDLEGTVVVDLTRLAIDHEAPLVLDRFNACSCDKCVEEFSKLILPRVPMRFARISKASQRGDSHELTERMEPVRKIVLSEMIRELIGNKKRCFHDD